MAYGAYEVVTYGGGETLRDTFISVALLAGGGPIDSAFRVAALTGLVVLILKTVFDFNVAAMLRWFLMAAMIYGVIWIPRVQVHVTDRFNGALTGADVANVPLGVAFVAATSTEIGDSAISVTETAFADPAGMTYSQNGMIYGAKLFSDAQSWSILDTKLAQTMQGYMVNCVAPDIITNTLTLDQVENTGALWAYLSANPNPSSQTPDYISAGGGAASCPTAANDITNAFPSEITQNEIAQQRRLQPTFATSNLQPTIAQSIDDYGNKVFTGTTSDTAFFQQVLTITSLRQSVGAYAALTPGSTALQNFAYYQGQNQAAQSANQVGVAAQKAIPVFQIVMLVLFIGMFPLMAPAFLLPMIGPKMLQAYMGGFLYLQLWGPMYVILNKLFNYVTLQQGTASTWVPPGSSAYANQAAVTFANLVSLSSTNQQISNVAGMMMMSIPVLAAALTKGAMDAGSHVGQLLGGLRASAEAAGQMVATRNISLGQTALDNVQFNNASANQVRTSPYIDTGASTTRSSDGGFITQAQNGSVIVNSGISQPGFEVGAGRAISQEARRAAASEHRTAEEISKAYSKAETQTSSAILESYQARSRGTEDRHSTGQDARAGVSEAASTLVDLQSNLQHQFGLSEEQARSWTRYIGANLTGSASAKGGVGIPKLPLGGSVEAGATLSASGGGRMQWSQGEKASAMINAGRQFLDRQDYSAKVDRARQSFATDNYADFAGISSGSRTANSRVFANADAVQSAVRESEGRSRSYSEVASRAENLSFDEKTKLTQGAVDYLYRTAIGKQGLYGHPIDRADMVQLLNPTGADAGTWTQLRQELLGPWLKQQTDQLLQSAAPVQDFPARTDLGRAMDAMDTRDSTAGARPRNSRLSRSDGHGGLKTTKQGTERVSDQPIAMPSANWDPLSAPRPNLPSEAARAANAAAAAGRLASERTGRTVKDAKKLDKFNQGKSNSPLQVADDE